MKFLFLLLSLFSCQLYGEILSTSRRSHGGSHLGEGTVSCLCHIECVYGDMYNLYFDKCDGGYYNPEVGDEVLAPLPQKSPAEDMFNLCKGDGIRYWSCRETPRRQFPPIF